MRALIGNEIGDSFRRFKRMLTRSFTLKIPVMLALLILLVSWPSNAKQGKNLDKLGPVVTAMKKAARSDEKPIAVIIQFSQGVPGQLKKEDQAKKLEKE